MARQIRSRMAHPYIEKRRGHRGGCAIIAGTSFPVSSVANYVIKQGLLPEELVRMFPHLKLAQVHDALSYYYDHQTEIDAEIEKNLGGWPLATALPEQEILRFKYDVASGDFVVSSLGKQSQ
jgi:uncharacterized protein (DUF433 family)